ncbi:hypothetical protein KIPB_006441 [Kipferlia bialata]|uniref:Uncharacterized protein n=1 Tax=Kipferlia bialata TaxID=797122 RepID=A0A9K3CS61_9EUKA|nr:hypothetical protein KIPB_003403 [Kipferlia bialata]GIQ84864.1 hypothetical protein KIPB_006441 [Kipferlia bialata]|eukprot:g3403.t1
MSECLLKCDTLRVTPYELSWFNPEGRVSVFSETSIPEDSDEGEREGSRVVAPRHSASSDAPSVCGSGCSDTLEECVVEGCLPHKAYGTATLHRLAEGVCMVLGQNTLGSSMRDLYNGDNPHPCLAVSVTLPTPSAPCAPQPIVVSTEALPYPVDRRVRGMALAVVGGRAYLHGGTRNEGHPSQIKDTWTMDLDTRRWVKLGSRKRRHPQGSRVKPPALYQAMAWEGEGQMLVAGGGNEHRPLKDLYSYDPEEQVWSQLPPMHIPDGMDSVDRRHAANDIAKHAVVDGTVYVLGGLAGIDSWQSYTPSPKWEGETGRPGRDVWHVLPTPPFRRVGCALLAYGTLVLVFGGYSRDGEGYNRSPVHAYDTISGI